MDETYLKEIHDVDWITEVISEQFDNALSFMTKDSVVYGGAVRDAIAGLPLIGDLDIAVTEDAAKTIANLVLKNPRWVIAKTEDGLRTVDSYGNITGLGMISSVVSFENEKKRIVQVISTGQKSDSSVPADTMARKVDIICCSMILTHDGRVFETVPGAYEDCKNRVLRINKDRFKTIELDRLKERIKKLVDRGWKDEIDHHAIEEEETRRRELLEKEALKEAPEVSDRTNVYTYPHMENVNFYEFSFIHVVENEAIKDAGTNRLTVINHILHAARKRGIYVVVIKCQSGVAIRTRSNNGLDHIKESVQTAFKHGILKIVREESAPNFFEKVKLSPRSTKISTSTSNTSFYNSFYSTSSTTTF